jgi:hypothetical protein
MLIGNECAIADKKNSSAYNAQIEDEPNVTVVLNNLPVAGTPIYRVTYGRPGSWDYDFTMGYTLAGVNPLLVVVGDRRGNYTSRNSGDLVPSSGVAAQSDLRVAGATPVDASDIYNTDGSGHNPAVPVETDSFTLAMPEPGTFALLGSGLIGLAFLLRRRS